MQCEFMQHSFNGQIFAEELDTGQAKVDIEFTRTGVSAMTTQGQFFEIPFSQCVVRAGGVDRRLLFCRHGDRSLTICCRDNAFPRALSEAAFGLLDGQLERQLKYSTHKAVESSLVGITLIASIAMLVLGAYLIGQI